MKRVFAVILAAGSSSRLGFNKLTIKIDGESVILRSVKALLGQSIEKAIVVTGHEHARVERELSGLPVEVVYNPLYGQGMSTSVRAVNALVRDADVIILHLGDKPFVKADVIASMLEKHLKEHARIVIPLHKGRKGHPVLMEGDLFRDEIGTLEGDRGFREVIEKYERDVVFIEGDEGSLYDIDTLQDIDRLRERGYTVEEG
jgi:molybdenum cofactor cytidylyltransferase